MSSNNHGVLGAGLTGLNATQLSIPNAQIARLDINNSAMRSQFSKNAMPDGSLIIDEKTGRMKIMLGGVEKELHEMYQPLGGAFVQIGLDFPVDQTFAVSICGITFDVTPSGFKSEIIVGAQHVKYAKNFNVVLTAFPKLDSEWKYNGEILFDQIPSKVGDIQAVQCKTNLKTASHIMPLMYGIAGGAAAVGSTVNGVSLVYHNGEAVGVKTPDHQCRLTISEWKSFEEEFQKFVRLFE